MKIKPLLRQNTDTDDDFERPTQRSTKQPLTKKIKMSNSPERKTNILLDKAINILDNRGAGQQENQEELFGRFIAQQLQKIDSRGRDFLRFKIQKLIFNYQFQQVHLPPMSPYHPNEVTSMPPSQLQPTSTPVGEGRSSIQNPKFSVDSLSMLSPICNII